MNTSYPDAAQMPDDSIVILHDCGRMDLKEILSSRLTEEEIILGKIKNTGSWLRQLVSKAPAVPWCGTEKYQEMLATDKAFRHEIGIDQ